MKNEKNEYFWKKQQQFWEMPEKTKFFNFRASQNEEKKFLDQKKHFTQVLGIHEPPKNFSEWSEV